MAGTVKHARLESPSARARLKRGRQPHWQALVEGKAHLGWQCRKGEPAGRWVLRRYVGSHKSKNGKEVARYRSLTLGRADDAGAADGKHVLSYKQAKAAADKKVTTHESGKIERLTVAGAMERYIDLKRSEGQPVKDLISRSTAHILPLLGNLVVAELTQKDLRDWLATLAASPAQSRPSKQGKPRYQAEPVSDEDVRRRRSSANRVLNMLKASLNHAFDEGHVTNRDVWGRKLKPFRNVEAARPGYFTVEEAKRLVNACDPDFRPLVRAALETGARYGELTRLQVADFHVDKNVGTITIRKSKTGKPRHVVLTEEATAFFRQHCAGRAGSELMFTRGGSKWKKSEQSRPMRAACEHARIKPAAGFHALRHTWASLAVMNGMPLMVVARNLGHASTAMVEKHYSHLEPSYIADQIRAAAPVYGIALNKKIVPLHS